MAQCMNEAPLSNEGDHNGGTTGWASAFLPPISEAEPRSAPENQALSCLAETVSHDCFLEVSTR